MPGKSSSSADSDVAVPKSGEVYYAEDGTVSMVLEDTYDPNYNPSSKELTDYAQWLGVDPNTEPDLMWIAEEGLRAPLPKEWKPCKTDSGEVYYFNFATGESIWDHPMDEVFKNKLKKEREKKKKRGGKGKDGEKKLSSLGSAAEVKKLSGRLTSIGGDEGPAPTSARPDVSDLVQGLKPAKVSAVPAPLGEKPLSQQPIGGSLTAKSASSVSGLSEADIAEYKARVDEEFAQSRKTLQTEHRRQLEKVALQNEANLQRQKDEMARDMNEEVESVRRAAERRKNREVKLWQDSIDNQLEDLQRTARQLTTQFDTEQESAGRRYAQEVASARDRIEREVQRETQRRKRQLEEDSERQKTAAKRTTETKVMEHREYTEGQTMSLEREQAKSYAQRNQALEEDQRRRVDEHREQLEVRRRQHAETLRHNAASAGVQHSPELQQAEADHAAKTAAARREKEEKISQLRADYEAKKTAELQAHMSAMENKATDVAAEMRRSEEARKAAQQRRAQEVDAFNASASAEEGQLETRLRAELDERIRAVTAAGASASSATATVTQVAEHRQRTMKQIEDEHNARVTELRRKHEHQMSDERKKAQEAKALGLSERLENWRRDAQAEEDRLRKRNADELQGLQTELDKLRRELDETKLRAESRLSDARREADSRRAAASSNVHSTAADDGIPALDVEREVNAYRRVCEAERDGKVQETVIQLDNNHRDKVHTQEDSLLVAMRGRMDSYRADAQRRVAERQAAVAAQPTLSSESPVRRDTKRKGSLGRRSNVVKKRPLAERLSEERAALEASLQRTAARLAEERATAQAQQLLRQSVSVRSSTGSMKPPLGGALAASQLSGGSFDDPMLLTLRSSQNMVQTPTTVNDPSPNFGDLPRRGSAGAHVDPANALQQGQRSTGASDNMQELQLAADEAKLAKAQEYLRQRRRSIRERQLELEARRVDWKRDMTAARKAQDTSQQDVLREARQGLELQARRLNTEALEFQEASAWLKGRLAEFKNRKLATKQQGRSHADPAAGPSNTEIIEALRAIQDKVTAVESQVAKLGGSGDGRPGGTSAAAAGLKTPSPQKSGHASKNASRGGAAMAEKWSSWLSGGVQDSTEQQHQDPTLQAVRASSGSGGAKGKTEQQQPSLGSALRQQDRHDTVEGRKNNIRLWLENTLS